MLDFMAKRTSKTTKKPITTSESDTLYLQSITRKILKSLEDAREQLENADHEILPDIKTSHELLFGKNSLAGALVILSDLLLKLSEKPEIIDAETAEENLLETLSAGDIALVDAFVRKLKDADGKQKSEEID